MAPKKTDPKDLITGGGLQVIEALSVGLPFEVWKTHMGTYRTETTMQAFRNVYAKNGVASFWAGWQPKSLEAFLKGGILLFSKEAIIRSCKSFGMSDVYSGLVGGFGGGVAQVTVMGPCTFLVTAAVTGDKSVSLSSRVSNTWKTQGVGGFYRGGTALILRQGSNWASRQGFTDLVREQLKRRHVSSNTIGSDGIHSSTKNVRLSGWEEALSGTIGGILSTWNQPFEVMRIEAQSRATRGLPPLGFGATYNSLVREAGFLGLFQGIIPRMGLCVAQTLFMVTVPHMLNSVTK